MSPLTSNLVPCRRLCLGRHTVHRNPQEGFSVILVSHCLLMTYIMAVGLLFVLALPPQRRPNAMTHTHPAADQNQIQKSLVPMLRTWTHSIGWTILLSAALAVLFAMICDGCSGIH